MTVTLQDDHLTAGAQAACGAASGFVRAYTVRNEAWDRR